MQYVARIMVKAVRRLMGTVDPVVEHDHLATADDIENCYRSLLRYEPHVTATPWGAGWRHPARPVET